MKGTIYVFFFTVVLYMVSFRARKILLLNTEIIGKMWHSVSAYSINKVALLLYKWTETLHQIETLKIHQITVCDSFYMHWCSYWIWHLICYVWFSQQVFIKDFCTYEVYTFISYVVFMGEHWNYSSRLVCRLLTSCMTVKSHRVKRKILWFEEADNNSFVLTQSE